MKLNLSLKSFNMNLFSMALTLRTMEGFGTYYIV